ncbi:UDP-N-acetylmuramoyl-tripeptide--D-alanyl-D-alanine ligase [Adhaeribacter aerolatus]|uniref:UDP-N-acetylmuramoyl-tripeptide--D-alanyl-D-alanine ligase n=1 Tax=Adhaeribacter aerolatus TaxID=670289 RepID=A0A512AS92_9BACT|nr:UDP-N-acetylmuramoyl-tripeptide--D-alanyl-D-alanine ligase [Adhaeribacter aerolatus]GEO02576.1 UDP-N-acetylmuramoyl-tripeptide--D-alanyl-D-alanine ligase [Adhaeribacter aerolatus]
MPFNIQQLYELYQQCQHVSTDSRADQHQSLFFALNGPNFKGAGFAQQALAKGARYAVVDDDAYACDNCFVVTDTLQALQDLATYHRQQLTIPIIGITGSNGKTTTKELTNAVLSQKYNTLYTQGNLNNHIGVPLTVLSIRPEHEIAIVEMGANHINEIAQLCSIALPTHGLITNIGKAHLEGFGSFEGVARAKSELYLHLDQHGGIVFVNSQNEHLMRMARRIENKILYPNAADFFHAEFLEASPFVVYQSENGEQVQTQIIGEYNFENIAAASCIGKFFEVPIDKINQAIAAYTPANNRSQVVQKGSNTILLDAYNANPSSMAASVTNFAKAKAAKKVVILGDMFELGPDSTEEHQKLGNLLAGLVFDEVLLCGQEMQVAAQDHSQFKYFKTKAALTTWLQQHTLQDTYLLIKGSRGMGLESLLDVL